MLPEAPSPRAEGPVLLVSDRDLRPLLAVLRAVGRGAVAAATAGAALRFGASVSFGAIVIDLRGRPSRLEQLAVVLGALCPFAVLVGVVDPDEGPLPATASFDAIAGSFGEALQLVRDQERAAADPAG